MHPIFRRTFNRIFGNFARKEDLNQLYAQVAVGQQIQRFIDPKAILGPLRNWATARSVNYQPRKGWFRFRWDKQHLDMFVETT